MVTTVRTYVRRVVLVAEVRCAIPFRAGHRCLGLLQFVEELDGKVDDVTGLLEQVTDGEVEQHLPQLVGHVQLRGVVAGGTHRRSCATRKNKKTGVSKARIKNFLSALTAKFVRAPNGSPYTFTNTQTRAPAHTHSHTKARPIDGGVVLDGGTSHGTRLSQ